MPRKCIPLFSRFVGIHVRFTTWFNPGFGRILPDRIEFILSVFRAQGRRANNLSSAFQGRVSTPRPFLLRSRQWAVFISRQIAEGNLQCVAEGTSNSSRVLCATQSFSRYGFFPVNDVTPCHADTGTNPRDRENRPKDSCPDISYRFRIDS